eukprot:sb/3474674/
MKETLAIPPFRRSFLTSIVLRCSSFNVILISARRRVSANVENSVIRSPSLATAPFSASIISLQSSISIAISIPSSDPNLPGPNLPEPRFTGRINFPPPPPNGKITVFDPDIPGNPIYRAKPFPPSISVNRGPTVY